MAKLFYSLNNEFLIYLMIGILLYTFCILDIIPYSIKKFLNKSCLKVIFLVTILYASMQNVNSAILLTILYFGIQNSVNIEKFNNIVTLPELDGDGNEILNDDLTIKQSINNNISNNLLDGIKSYNETIPLADKERNTIKKIIDKCNNGNPTLTDFEKQNFVLNEDDSMCGNTAFQKSQLMPMTRCSMNKIDSDKMYNENSIEPCLAAFGKTYKTVCLDKNFNGECTFEDGTLADPNNIDILIESGRLASKESFENVKNKNGLQVISHTLDTIKDTYLRYNDFVGYENNGIIPFRDIENNFYYKLPTDVVGMIKPIPIESSTSQIPFLKLASGYEYDYEFYSTQNASYELTKNIYESDTYAPRRASPTDVDPLLVNIEGTYSPIRIIIKEPSGAGNLYDLGIYKYEQDESYQFKLYDYNTRTQIPETDILSLGLFELETDNTGTSRMMKHANLKQLNNDGTETSIDLTDSNGNVIKKYHPEFQDKLKLKQEKYVRKSKYIKYKPFVSNETVGSDKYVEEINNYSKNKLNWENNASKVIMRSIGCHRLRNPLTYDYGYWDSGENKCKYEKEVAVSAEYPTTVG